MFGLCVSLSATTAIEDSSKILAIQFGVEEPPAVSLFQQFPVDLRTHFSFPCNTELEKVEQIVQWKTASCAEMVSI